MFVCLISPKLRNRFLNSFFLLKTEIHVQILNTEPVLCFFRGLRYLQNKTQFRNRQVHIHTYLKWSSQPQSGLEMSQRTPEWPGKSLRDQFGQFWASRQSVGASQGHSGSVRTTTGQYEYKLVYFGTAFCFTNISAP